jgi:hypothetical protein
VSVSEQFAAAADAYRIGESVEIPPVRERTEPITVTFRELCSDVVSTPEDGSIQCDRAKDHQDDHSSRIPERDAVVTWPQRAPDAS